MKTSFAFFDSPIGCLSITAEGSYLTSVSYCSEGSTKINRLSVVVERVLHQLGEYFAGISSSFKLPLCPTIGTPFQRKVWSALQDIPVGATCSYRDIAVSVGVPNAQRAVGQANNKNPFVIIVPCHRVIGSNGRLTGYAGGLDKKSWLLNFEEIYN